MGITNLPSIPSNGLAFCLDAGNRKSYTDMSMSLINMDNWTTGSGGVTGYNQNGSTSENERVVANDPWDNSVTVWEY